MSAISTNTRRGMAAAASANFTIPQFFGTCFGGQRVAVKQDINISYIHGDHLGSTSKTTGASSSTQTYYPYGAIKTSSGTVPTDYDFTGQKRDATANLMFYNARYYDPALARFIQPDTIVPNPLDPQSLNRYAYVRNNPVNRIDPTGHEDCAAEDDWCWQNRWYEAHGYCWSDTKQDWAKQCTPEFQDEDILSEVLGENGGLNIVMQANMLKVFAMLMQQIQQSISNVPPPNFLIIGVQISGNLTPLYGEGSLQMVFDFQHLEIGWFVSGGFGGGGSSGAGFSTDQMLHLFGSASVSIQIGVGWCVAPGCTGVSNYAGSMQEHTLAAGIPIPAFPVGPGLAGTYAFTPDGIVTTFTLGASIGTASFGANINGVNAWEVYKKSYWGDPAGFALQVQIATTPFGNSFGVGVNQYASFGYPFLCSIASNKSTCR